MSLIDMRDGVLSRTLEGMVGSKNKGGSFVRRHVIPTDPKSTAQLNRRQRMREISEVVRQAVQKGLPDHIYPPLKQISYLGFMMKWGKPFMSGASNNPNLYNVTAGSLHNLYVNNWSLSESSGLIHVQWRKRNEGELTDASRVRAWFWNRTITDSILSDEFAFKDNMQDIPHPWTYLDTVFMQIFAYNPGVSTSFPRNSGKAVTP